MVNPIKVGPPFADVYFSELERTIVNMSEGVKRSYNSPQRQRKAEITKDVIMSAARRLFAAHGYQGTTIEAIATEAAVAVQTVYFTFGSKAAILSRLVASGGADPAIRRVAQRAMAEPESRRRLELGTRVISMIMDRDRDIVDLLTQAGTGNSELVEAWRQSHQQQLGRMTELLEPIARQGHLRRGMSHAEAVDVLLAVASPEVHRLLTHERKWSQSRYRDWLARSAIDLLLAN